MPQVVGLAAEFLQQLLGRFQRLLFSEALLSVLGDALALQDAQAAAPEHTWQPPKRSCVIDTLAKVRPAPCLPHGVAALLGMQ